MGRALPADVLSRMAATSFIAAAPPNPRMQPTSASLLELRWPQPADGERRNVGLMHERTGRLQLMLPLGSARSSFLGEVCMRVHEITLFGLLASASPLLSQAAPVDTTPVAVVQRFVDVRMRDLAVIISTVAPRLSLPRCRGASRWPSAAIASKRSTDVCCRPPPQPSG